MTEKEAGQVATDCLGLRHWTEQYAAVKAALLRADREATERACREVFSRRSLPEAVARELCKSIRRAAGGGEG